MAIISFSDSRNSMHDGNWDCSGRGKHHWDLCINHRFDCDNGTWFQNQKENERKWDIIKCFRLRIEHIRKHKFLRKVFSAFLGDVFEDVGEADSRRNKNLYLLTYTSINIQ